MMNATEINASGLLLNLGVSIPLRPLRFIGNRKQRHIIIRYPCWEGIIRIARKFLLIGVTKAELAGYTPEQNAALIAGHGKEISEMVAYAFVPWWLYGKWSIRMVAWWLRHRVHPLFLSEAMFQLSQILSDTSFQNIIISAEMVNPMKPRVSRERKGS